MRHTHRLSLAVAMAAALHLPPGTGAAAAAPAPPAVQVTAATADAAGYHLFAAGPADGWRWRALATLRPGPDTGEPWIGEQCLTGDASFVVAVVAPWSAQNREAGIAQGGVAYAVDTRTGAVRALASHVALAYFDPGCGQGGTAALTRYLASDQARTEVLVADAASGAVTSAGAVSGEVTSAVPDGSGVLAAQDSRLVRLR